MEKGLPMANHPYEEDKYDDKEHTSGNSTCNVCEI